MKNTDFLTKCEFEIIRLSKLEEIFFEDIKLWYAKRCNLNVEYIENEYLFYCLFDLVQEIYKENNQYFNIREFFKNGSPRRDIFYPDAPKCKNINSEYERDQCYYGRFILVCVNILRNTKVSWLPGYKEWIEKQ